MAFSSKSLYKCVYLCVGVSLFAPNVSTANNDFDAWKAQQQQQFSQYLSQEDKAFSEFLRREWEEFQVFQGHARDATPKPPTPPAVRNNVLAPSIQPNVPGDNFLKKRYLNTSGSVTGFYGHSISAIKLPLNVNALPKLSPPSNDRIADAWVTLASTPHDQTISQLKQLGQQLQLSDWGMLKLVEYLVSQQVSNNSQQQVYTWFLMNKLGYDIKIGYSHSKLILLTPATVKIYDNQFSVINTTSYYLYPAPEDGKLFTYQGESQPGKALDVSFKQLIAPSGRTHQVEIWLETLPEPITLSFDPGVSSFLYDHPQIELDWYFRAKPVEPTRTSLVTALDPLVSELSEREAVNFLLHFTQRVFQYQTDQDQFGREKYLTVDESLRYGVNDCEDRSIFLAWLTKSLLNIEVMALDYPGHIALAVKTIPRPNDDFIVYQGHKYVIADPTYIGANLGMAMPSLKKHTPKVIEIDELSL